MSMHTKSGFLKPFSCCGHWNVCNMGKGTCFYAEKDPETMHNCRAFQRNNNESLTAYTVAEDEMVQEELPLEVKEEKTSQEEIEIEQLSLFF